MESFADLFSASVVHDREHPALLAELDKLAGTFDPERRWVNSDSYTLSDRVWLAGQETRAQIDNLVKSALLTGEDALDLARKLEVFLQPNLQPVRDASGSLVRDSARNQRREVVTGMPGRGGRGSFAARRLARTEISRAHAEATQQSAELNPWVTGLRWALSGRHPKDDICSDHADRDNGHGRGVYLPRETPMLPAHPMCLCHWEFVVADDVNGVVDALKFRYQLGELDVAQPAPRPLSLVDRAIAAAVRLASAVFGRVAA